MRTRSESTLPRGSATTGVPPAPRSARPASRVGAAGSHVGERALLLGTAASFLAVASAAALSTMDDTLRWPAILSFLVALVLGQQATRLLRTSPPTDG